MNYLILTGSNRPYGEQRILHICYSANDTSKTPNEVSNNDLAGLMDKIHRDLNANIFDVSKQFKERIWQLSSSLSEQI